MNHHIHHCAFETVHAVQTQFPIHDLEVKVQLLCGLVNNLQSHCAHLEEVLRANNITMPPKE